MNSLRRVFTVTKSKSKLIMYNQQGDLSGGGPAGKGGGEGAGTIREAGVGGSFGKLQVAREEEYFYKKGKDQIQSLKTNLNEEINFHENEIKKHQDAITRNKRRVADIDKI